MIIPYYVNDVELKLEGTLEEILEQIENFSKATDNTFEFKDGTLHTNVGRVEDKIWIIE